MDRQQRFLHYIVDAVGRDAPTASETHDKGRAIAQQFLIGYAIPGLGGGHQCGSTGFRPVRVHPARCIVCLIRGSATAGAVIGESDIEHGKRKGCNGLRQGADITFPCAIFYPGGQIGL